MSFLGLDIAAVVRALEVGARRSTWRHTYLVEVGDSKRGRAASSRNFVAGRGGCRLLACCKTNAQKQFCCWVGKERKERPEEQFNRKTAWLLGRWQSNEQSCMVLRYFRPWTNYRDTLYVDFMQTCLRLQKVSPPLGV